MRLLLLETPNETGHKRDMMNPRHHSSTGHPGQASRKSERSKLVPAQTRSAAILCGVEWVLILLASILFAMSGPAAQGGPLEEAKEALIRQSDDGSAAVSTEKGTAAKVGDPTQLLFPLDGTYTLVDFFGDGPSGAGPAEGPDQHNDDDSATIALPFTFTYYGNSYNSVFVNNNGNLTFGSRSSAFTTQAFPFPGALMIAPFWADVDTGNPTNPVGDVWMKTLDGNGDNALDTLVVTWDNVGYFNEKGDKRNTFQVAISDGTNPSMGVGRNVAFSYDQMQWTSGDASLGINGLDGVPATVGINAGDGIHFIQIGRFDHAGSDYDGPAGNADGISYLDGQVIRFDASTADTNVSPIPVNFPPDHVLTIDARLGEVLDLDLQFLSPEVGQTTTVTIDDANNAAAAGLSIINTPGNAATVQLDWVPENDDAGVYVLNFTATDSFVPAGSTEISLTINIAGMTPRLSLIPSEFCVTNPDHQVAVDIELSDIDPAHPIWAANINLEWESCACWNVVDIVPGPGFDQFGSENTGPGFVFYSVTRSLTDFSGIVEAQVIATITFQATLPADGCCVQELSLTEGSGGSATVVVGDFGYEVLPILGDPKEIRIDQQAPAITCSPDMTVSTWPDQCHWKPDKDELVIWPVVVDNCDDCPPVVTWQRSDGRGSVDDLYEVGDTFITWTAIDCCGNSASCVQQIHVEDREPPVINLPADSMTVAADENCRYILPDVRSLATITDNCTPDPNVQQTPVAGTILNVGSHDVVINANDSHGNNTGAVLTIVVADQTPPEITLAPENMEVIPDAGKCSAVVEWAFAATDNCNAVIIDCDPPSGSRFCWWDAPYNVTCTATDPAGNVATHNFQIDILPYWRMNVEIDVKGYISNNPFPRCVELELTDCDNILPPQSLYTTVWFVRGENGIGAGSTTVDLPIPLFCPCDQAASYDCARAKMARYSLWSTTSGPDGVYIEPDGRSFHAVFTDNSRLILGDINNSGWVGIDDWLIWAKQFQGITPVPLLPDDLCDPFPDPTDPGQQIADISGDGRVSAIDYGHLYVNNTLGDVRACCTKAAKSTSDEMNTGPITRLSIFQLRVLGIDDASLFDLNDDGFVDSEDVRLTTTIRRN